MKAQACASLTQMLKAKGRGPWVLEVVEGVLIARNGTSRLGLAVLVEDEPEPVVEREEG